MAIQANIQQGKIVRASNSALLGKENLLVKLVTASTGPGLFDLPAAVTDLALFVLIDGKVLAGDPVEALPLYGDQEVRIIAKGTGSAGDVLIHADPGTPADIGKVRSLTGSAAPSSAGVYFSPGIAEEDFIDGQTVLVRPCPEDVHLASTFTATGTEATDIAALQAILQAHGLVA